MNTDYLKALADERFQTIANMATAQALLERENDRLKLEIEFLHQELADAREKLRVIGNSQMVSLSVLAGVLPEVFDELARIAGASVPERKDRNE